MRGDLHSRSRGFESLHQVLDGNCFTFYCCKNCNELFEKTENQQKRDRESPIYKKLCDNSIVTDLCR